MTFGEKLRDGRTAAGMTQMDLAATSGVPLGTIREYEQGIRDPSLQRAQKLAAAIGKTLNDLAGDLSEVSQQAVPPGRPRKAPVEADDKPAKKKAKGK